MFLGLGIRDRDQNLRTCWPLLQFGFKMYFVLSLLVCVVSIFYPPLQYYLANIPQKTVESLQLWRLFSSFLVTGVGIRAILGVLFNFYMLYITLPDTQKMYSTAYCIIEVLLQLFLSNLTLILIGYPLIYLQVIPITAVVGYGILPVVINSLWQTTARNPEEPTKFWCFPCLIPAKYIPLIVALLAAGIFEQPVINCLIYTLLGLYQHMIRKRSLLPLTLAVYKKFDAIMPNGILNNFGYVKVSKVQAELAKICSNGCCGDPLPSETENANDMIGRVEVIGIGTSIGGSVGKKSNDPKAFKAHWEKKELEEQQNYPPRAPQPPASPPQPEPVQQHADEFKLQTRDSSEGIKEQQEQNDNYVRMVDDIEREGSINRLRQQQQKDAQKQSKDKVKNNKQKHYPLVEEEDYADYT